MKNASWIAIGIFSTLIGLYPLVYFFNDRKFGLLASKPEELLTDTLWNIAFQGHITLAGIALLIGWLQFSNKLKTKNITLHRRIGKTYVFSVLVSGVCGLFIALYATGGIINILGFSSLAIVWLSTTIFGLLAIKKNNVELHKTFKIFSFATCFAAVTLRIWLPVLTSAMSEFICAQRIVAWLCWVPNIIVAFFIVKKENTKTNYSIAK